MHINRKEYLIISLIASFFIFIFSYGAILSTRLKCKDADYIITIDKNSNLNTVALQLEEEMCINKYLFKISMYLTFNQNKIKFGRHDLSVVRNIRDLVSMVTSINTDKVKVTLLEGWRVQDIALELEHKMNIDVEKFIYLCYDNNMIDKLDLSDKISSLEGFLFPDTYFFLKTYTEKDIIEVLVSQFKNNYDKNIQNRTELSVYETIILASIIEGESKFKADMDTISSVYHNRLMKNMLLQADPTVQYLMPKQKKNLLYKDIKIDSPYNTYIYKGLPPGPINSPGMNAIIAASDPAKSNFLYFVSNGEGTHIFNHTYKKHLTSKRNVSRKFK